MLSMLSVDDPQFSDMHWEQFHRFLADMHARGLGNVAPNSWEVLRKRTVGRLELKDGFREWVILEGSEVVGWWCVHFRSAADGSHPTCALVFNFRPDVDVRVLAPMAAALVATAMRNNNSLTAYCLCPEAHLDCLREAWGGRILSRVRKFRLDRQTANRDLIRRWLMEYPTRYPSLHVEIFTEIPDAYVDAWIELFRQCLEDMPNEGSPGVPFTMTREEVRRFEGMRRANGQCLYTAALFDSEGQMIGHSNMAAHNNPPTEWHQAMTGIDRSWRGRGLSKWLKAALFVRTGDDFPESRYILTEMRAVNEPIHVVNRAMGFELVSEGYEWSIERSTLEALTARPGV